MKVEAIRQTIDLWNEQPESAKSKPTVTARLEGSRAVMEAGQFSWHADLPQPLGGMNQAPSPTALLLSALAGCAVVFIANTLAPQLGVRIGSVEATARCETDARGLLGLDGTRPDLQNMHLDIRVDSPDDEAAVQTLFQTWEERCPVYLALIKEMDVSLNMQTS
jgi:uncharacterized OsmC-like protein